MGMILLPFLLMALGAFITSVVFEIHAITKGTLTLYPILFGIIISMCIYALLFRNYKASQSAYALGVYFMFPIYMVILPFVLGMLLKFFPYPFTFFVSNGLFVSVILSGLFMVLFSKYTFGIIDLLGLPKNY